MVNDVGEGVSIDADTNAATFLTLTTAVEMPQMAKRQLADRILDEILALRRPRPVVVELDGIQDAQTRERQSRQDRILEETVPAVSARGQLIVE